MTYTVLDLFSGAGGFSLGFLEESYRIAAAVESFPQIAKTYMKNFPDTKVFVSNIRNLTGRLVLETIDDEIDVLIGGPPCIPFTARNPKRKAKPEDRIYSDKMGSLVLEFFRFVREIKPKAYVMENVYGIYELRHIIKRVASEIGYEAHFHVWNCEKYGLPSKRKRVFISNLKLREPEPRNVKVWDVLKNFTYSMPNAVSPKIPKKFADKIDKMKWGDALVYFRGADGVKKNWIRLHPHRIAPPITATSRFIHPYEPRALTVREHAMLMSFPENFVFYGSIKIQLMGVGDAVPPLIARHIAREVRALI